MSICQCGYDWASPVRCAVTTVQAFPARLTQLLQDTGVDNNADRLRTRPAPHVWSPLEYMAHTGDAITWYAGRVTRLLAEQRPALEPFDWDSYTDRQHYHQRHLDTVLTDIGDICARFTAVLVSLDAAEWQREGTGSDGHPRTVAQLVKRAAHEAHHHLHDINVGLTAADGANIRDDKRSQIT